MPASDAALRDVLGRARELGAIGPAGVDAAIEHARGFLDVLRPTGRVIDLGSGAGLPGLVLAVHQSGLAVVLVDSSERRTDELRRAVRRLDLSDRVEVVTAQAEVLGRDPSWRAGATTVVARGFGAPGVVAEVAAGLLGVGGQLVVSEPPAPDPARWPADGLAGLGLARDPLPTERYASFTQVAACPAVYPRRRLVPPLF